MSFFFMVPSFRRQVSPTSSGSVLSSVHGQLGPFVAGKRASYALELLLLLEAPRLESAFVRSTPVSSSSADAGR